MINLPYEEILRMIQEKSGLSEEEVAAKVNDKLNQLSGLISKEGAAHIIANEMNLQITPKEGQAQKIKNVAAGMRNVVTQGKVQQVYEVREFNSSRGPGKVGSFLFGDETGMLRVVLWNDQVDILEKLNQGDIVKIEGAYSRDNNGRKELHINTNSKIDINPEGVSVGEVKRNVEAERKKIADLTQEDSRVEILGTIVQVFDMRFFEVCPECSKRVRPDDSGSYNCPTHGNVTPDYSYVFNIFIDDSTSNIRVVFFRNQLEKLLNRDHDQILKFRENPQEFENVKHDLLGHIVKVIGRVVNNDMFNRLEIISNVVFMDPDPEEELDKMKKEQGNSNSDQGTSSNQSQTQNQEENVASSDTEQVKPQQPAQAASAAHSVSQDDNQENKTVAEDVSSEESVDTAGQEQPGQENTEVQQEQANQEQSQEESVSHTQEDSQEPSEESKKQDFEGISEEAVDELDSIDEEDLGNLDEEFFDEDNT